jgi:pyruvate-ferredoxin/flavodoxin oxidoreductase
MQYSLLKCENWNTMKNDDNFIIADGNNATAIVAWAFAEVVPVYPITPSTPMSEAIGKFAAGGGRNIFGKTPTVIEMQSEVGCAGILHGALTCGTLGVTFTSSQGLLLMIPELYRIAGEFLPGVIHVASRAVAGHALSIFGDHSDVYACRGTGAAMICSVDAQECADLAVCTHLSAIESSALFIHFFDGFRTSHEAKKIKISDYETLRDLMDENALIKFRKNSLGPGITRGTNQNDDIYFQWREAANMHNRKISEIVFEKMVKISEKTGRNYAPFSFYGSENADTIIIAMGSVCGAIEEAVDFLNTKNENVGFVKVTLFRPFVSSYLLEIIPSTVKRISVLDRSKEGGTAGEPLFMDVCATLYESGVKIFGGIYGLGSKNTDVRDIIAVFENMKSESKKHFTIGINDDVTKLSIAQSKVLVKQGNVIEIQIWGFGSDGAVSASKIFAKMVGKNTRLYVQSYPQYDSKKSGGLTISHLRFSPDQIKSPYYVEETDFFVCQHFDFIFKYDLASKMKKNSVFVLNSPYGESETVQKIPGRFLKFLEERNIKFYILNADRISLRFGLGNRVGTAFFAILTKLFIPELLPILKENLSKIYCIKGKSIVEANLKCAEKATENVKLIDLDRIEPNTEIKIEALDKKKIGAEYVASMIDSGRGNELPVSVFLPFADGSVPGGTADFCKKYRPQILPSWNPQKCMCCGICSISCPHGVIFASIKNLIYSLNFNYDFCTGCGVCAKMCPIKAISMEKNAKNKAAVKSFTGSFDVFSVSGVQFKEPLIRFGGACAGCGQPAYARLVTQLFGSNLFIANATGCSSIWGGQVFSTPYKCAWQNSLLEDNAEFGLGMALAQKMKKEDSCVWIFGGDGWAYDIGFGGLDHVIASGENINILIFDTEIYSNTGGQCSKATPAGVCVPFASNGKKTKKKNLAKMMAKYKNIYIAKVNLLANPHQCITAIKEAKEFNGPSLVIAYSPCIGHGIRGGMENSPLQARLAVKSGHWSLFRFNPTKGGMKYDSKPDVDFKIFSENEERFRQ